jgi:hypothetical protein
VGVGNDAEVRADCAPEEIGKMVPHALSETNSNFIRKLGRVMQFQPYLSLAVSVNLIFLASNGMDARTVT